jgi:hypothetical protein
VKKKKDGPTTKADTLDSAAEPDSRNDTEHLLASPANAERLRSAIRSSLAGEGMVVSVEDLRTGVGLGPADPTC